MPKHPRLVAFYRDVSCPAVCIVTLVVFVLDPGLLLVIMCCCKVSHIKFSSTIKEVVQYRMSISRQDLENVFAHFAGRDESLSRREFARVLEHLGLPTSRHFINTLLSQVDDDGSGDLDVDEFCSIFLPEDAPEDDGFDENEARAVFDLFSRGDGEISTQELRRALASLGIRTSGRQARTLLREVDADGSGSLSYQEFVAMMRQLNRQQSSEKPPEEFQQAAGMYGSDVQKPQRKEITKGVFVGINYAGTDAELKGCVNDVRLIRSTIQKVMGLPIREERVLVEDTSFTGFTGMPTLENIKDAMKWLVAGASPGDTLFLHYSGHGGTMQERVRGSEASGKDQCIFPIDFQKSGVIIDDDIRAWVVNVLPPGVRLTAVFDCCHSGSIMDLPFNATPESQSVDHKTDDNSAIAGSVTMFAGCRDDQTSADAYQGEGTWGGALTYSLSTTLATGASNASVTKLLQDMRKSLAGKYTQIPQLSSSHAFDLDGGFSLFGASTEEL
jgi:metacaspase-1